MDMAQKITKILEKANSTTSPQEAETLMAKALKLMQDHQIEAHQLGSDPFDQRKGRKFQKGTSAALRYEIEAYVAEFLDLRVVFSEFKRRPGERLPYALYIFVGPESALVTHSYLAPFVWSQVRRLANENAKRFGLSPRKVLRDLVDALGVRISEMLLARRNSTPAVVAEGANALVLIRGELDTYFDKLFPNLGEAKVKTVDPSWMAVDLADQVSLDLQVGDGDLDTPLLLR